MSRFERQRRRHPMGFAGQGAKIVVEEITRRAEQAWAPAIERCAPEDMPALRARIWEWLTTGDNPIPERRHELLKRQLRLRGLA